MDSRTGIYDIAYPTDALTVRQLKCADDRFRTSGDYYYPGCEWSPAHAVTREVQLAIYYWHKTTGERNPIVDNYFTQERLGRITGGLLDDYVGLGLAANRDAARRLVSTIEEQVQALADRHDAPKPGAADRFGTRVAEARAQPQARNR